MQLLKIRLENITTYKDTVIKFQSGINILSGKNGTGKSTVLKMIGYALFDYFPEGKHADFIRKAPDAKKTGKVTIWFTGKDGEEFSVERSLGQSRIHVKSYPSGRDLHGIRNKSELRRWLRVHITIEQQIELSTIFKNAIGVEQGTFTAPFLETPGRRRDIFAPILNVDIYRIMNERYAVINKEFEKEFTALSFKIQEVEVELRQKQELLKEQTELNKKVKTLDKGISQTQKQLTSDEEKYSSLKEIKDHLETCSQDLKQNQFKFDNLEKNIKKNKKQLVEALSAKNLCDKSRESFESYDLIEKEEKKLRKKESQLHKFQTDLNKLLQKYAKIESLIGEKSKSTKDIITLQKKYEDLTRDHIEFQKISLEIEKNQKQLTKITTIKEQLQIKEKKSEDLRLSVTNLEDGLKHLPILEKELQKLETVQNHIIEQERVVTRLQTEEQQLLQNRDASKGGSCPFLHEKCKNIGEDSLKDYFQGQIDSGHDLILKEQAKLKSSKNRLMKLQDKKKKMEVLSRDQVKIDEIKTQLKNLIKEISQMCKDIQPEPQLVDFSHELQKKHEKLKEKSAQYHIVHQKMTVDLPKFQSEISTLSESVKIIEDKMVPLKKAIHEIESVPDQLQKLQHQKETKKEAHDQYQKHIKLAETYLNLVKLSTEDDQRLVLITKILTRLTSERKKLQKQFRVEDFLRLENQRLALNKLLGKFEGELTKIEEHLQQVQQKLSKIAKKEEIWEILVKQRIKLEEIDVFSKTLRTWIKEAGPIITEALMDTINSEASNLYRKLIDEEAVDVIWTKDYNVKLRTSTNTRYFAQLSGGEQMLVALAIRLAILEILTTVDFAFFDEPTTNLDAEKRLNLAGCLQKLSGFKQIFVISHDDTFKAGSDYVINFTKTENEETVIKCINPGTE